MDPRQDLRDAIELLADLSEAHTVALFLPDFANPEVLRPVVWHTLGKSFLSDKPIRKGEGLVGYVAKHGQPVDIDRNPERVASSRIYGEDEGVKAFLAMPVGDFGVLTVDTRKRSVFGEREKKVVKQFAKFFANLVMHQDTCSRENLYGRTLDLLYDVENASLGFCGAREYYSEVLGAGRRYTGLSMGLLCLLHPGRKQFTVEAVEGPSLSTLRGRSFPVSQGLVGWIFREVRPLTHSRLRPMKGRSYLIAPEEVVRDINAFVGVPLLAWRRLAGVWAFAGRSERIMDSEEERALQLAGHRVASTIEHYNLLPS